MNDSNFKVRKAEASEYAEIGQLLVNVYSKLEGFPKQEEQPEYYKLLANIGELTTKPGTEILVAVAEDSKIAGALVYFADMKYYGSGGIATSIVNASGFRLLAVANSFRQQGIGKLLTKACIKKAQDQNADLLIIHSTRAMQVAWKMYQEIGFKRAEELDFLQGDLQVFGFEYKL